MFYNILDEKRIEILKLLKNFKDNFYLAGGTALALQLGHRDSVDFDFFTQDEIDTLELFKKIEKIFSDYKIQKVQDEKNTLTVVLNENIKLSFFTYKYELFENLTEEDYVRLASVKDIASMKLSAITSRATEKDYVDLYFILQDFSLNDLLKYTKKKFKTLDEDIILKSLVYFDDVVEEKIVFKNNKNISFQEIKAFLKKLVREYYELA